jgi:hypothetical protein
VIIRAYDLRDHGRPLAVGESRLTSLIKREKPPGRRPSPGRKHGQTTRIRQRKIDVPL